MVARLENSIEWHVWRGWRLAVGGRVRKRASKTIRNAARVGVRDIITRTNTHARTCEFTIERTRFSVSHRGVFPHVVRWRSSPATGGYASPFFFFPKPHHHHHRLSLLSTFALVHSPLSALPPALLLPLLLLFLFLSLVSLLIAPPPFCSWVGYRCAIEPLLGRVLLFYVSNVQNAHCRWI